MNKKRGFIISLTVLLCVMSMFICSLYDDVRNNDKMVSKQDFVYDIEDSFQLAAIGMVQAIDPKYDFFEFSDNVDENIQELVRNDLKGNAASEYLFFANDQNFHYYIRDTKTKKELGDKHLSSLTTDNLKDSSYVYSVIRFDEDGNATINGDFYNMGFALTPIDEYSRFSDYGSTYYINGYDLELSKLDVSVKNPKNMEIIIQVPKEVVKDGNFIANRIYNASQTAEVPLTAMIVGAIIIGIYMFFYPISIVREVNPYYSFQKMKLEIALILFTLILGFGGTGMIYLSMISIDGTLIESFKNINGTIAEWGIVIINVAAWMLFFLLVSIAYFIIKKIFVKGFWKSIKEDTVIGSIVCGISHYMSRLADFDLKDPLHKRLFIFILIQIGIVFVLCFFFAFGSFLAILYGIFLYIWLRKRLEKIQEDYGVILKQTAALKEGNFRVEMSEDVGLFESMKDDLLGIRVGFEKAVKEEMKSQNMKTELISNVSHDLKTPLTGIRNYIELLQQEEISEEQQQEYLKMLEQYSHRLQVLMEDLFEISKANSGNIQLEMTKLDIVALVEQVQAECSEGLTEHQLDVVWSLPEESNVYVMLDGNKAYRIFENLFVNVQRYAMEHTRVYIDIKKYAGYVRIECKNISKEPLNFDPREIMERFVRGDKSRHDGGSGLGLAIVKSFTEAMQGTFTIETDGDLFKAILTFPTLSDTKETDE